MESLKQTIESDNDTTLIKPMSKEDEEQEMFNQNNNKGNKQRKENYLHIKSERETKNMNLLQQVKQVYLREIKFIEAKNLLSLVQNKNHQNLILIGAEKQIKGAVCFRVYKEKLFAEVLFVLIPGEGQERVQKGVSMIRHLIRLLLQQNVHHILTMSQKIDTAIWKKMDFQPKAFIKHSDMIVYEKSHVKGTMLQCDLSRFIQQQKQVSLQQQDNVNEARDKSQDEIKNDDQNKNYIKATFTLMEEKNMLIRNLEQDILNISLQTKDFTNFLKEQIILDSENQKNMIRIMSRNEMEEVIEVDPNILLSLQKSVIELSQQMEDDTELIYQGKVIEPATSKKDMMLAYHQLESKYKRSLRDEENMQAQLNHAIKTLEDTDNKNKAFLKKTRVILGEYRQDYKKLVKYLMVKNKDMETIRLNSGYKQDVISKLEEKLLTVYTLEYKIKDLFNTHIKDMSDIDKDYRNKVQASQNPFQSQPNLLRAREQNTRELGSVKETIKNEKVQIFRVMDKQQKVIKDTDSQKEELQKVLRERKASKIKLQGQLSSLNKECNRIKRENERMTKEVIVQSRLFNKQQVKN